jgi:hypothetical protein
MFRFRVLFFLFPLILLSQNRQIVQAAPRAGKISWAPGVYIGTVSIDAHEYVALQPLPEGTLHEEHDLEIPMSTGRMQIVVGKQGSFSVGFSIPIRFRYWDWSQVEDVGTGICEGQRSESAGYGTLRLSGQGGVPSGNTFRYKAQPFKVEGFSGCVLQFGKQCPEVDVQEMRSTMEGGFAALFANEIEFEIIMTQGNVLAGYCRMPGYELEGDHAFDCTWYVQFIPPKKK